MTMIDDWRCDRDAQLRRAETVTGGYRAETASYFGADGEGDAVERPLTFKQYLKDNAEPSAEYREQWSGETHVSPETWSGFDDSSLSDRDFFTMHKPDLKALQQVGSTRASRELDRRTARRLERKGNRS